MLDKSHLDGATLGNGDLLARLAAATAVALDLLDDIHPLDNLTKNNVLAVEPAGHDGGDEELGAVAVGKCVSLVINTGGRVDDRSLRVRASVSHGQHERLVVGALEILVGELLAVDGLAAGTLIGTCQ